MPKQKQYHIKLDLIETYDIEITSSSKRLACAIAIAKIHRENNAMRFPVTATACSNRKCKITHIQERPF